MTEYSRRTETNLLKYTGWSALGYAIVYQAIKDYKQYDTSIRDLIEIREFFNSSWFRRLCDYDNEEILARLDKYRERMGYVDINVIIRRRDAYGYNISRAKRLDRIRNKKGSRD